MSPARPATSAARRPRTDRGSSRPRPRRVAPFRGPISKVRWDRAFRTLMLGVFALVITVGVQGVVTYMHTRAEADQQLGVVQSLARANRALLRQQASFNDPTTIVQDARALGMVRQGERAYVVTGLPGH